MSDVIFDEQGFYNHLGGDRELGSEILNVYVVDAPERLKALEQALADEEQALVIKYSHALKGISATIRAGAIAAQAERIEHAARKGDFETVRNCMPQAIFQLDEVLEVIRKHLR
ncbi:Hpt domain-containing protein [Desulfovibrio sp. JC010]|uniref:Hpt domain-containing protein n=1 Tax=Desulfovibrio sp. JC010 TaxID=2593641 RepID=UPI0013D5B0DB|nr:Hpt domain-containing protein [Desulfovibrio sp. JC010]NDV25784.1 Hpt domain-containing protein [Desulfovibrio sp. JC010]